MSQHFCWSLSRCGVWGGREGGRGRGLVKYLENSLNVHTYMYMCMRSTGVIDVFVESLE